MDVLWCIPVTEKLSETRSVRSLEVVLVRPFEWPCNLIYNQLETRYA